VGLRDETHHDLRRRPRTSSAPSTTVLQTVTPIDSSPAPSRARPAAGHRRRTLPAGRARTKAASRSWIVARGATAGRVRRPDHRHHPHRPRSVTPAQPTAEPHGARPRRHTERFGLSPRRTSASGQVRALCRGWNHHQGGTRLPPRLGPRSGPKGIPTPDPLDTICTERSRPSVSLSAPRPPSPP
jgi:hypothetical protein